MFATVDFPDDGPPQIPMTYGFLPTRYSGDLAMANRFGTCGEQRRRVWSLTIMEWYLPKWTASRFIANSSAAPENLRSFLPDVLTCEVTFF